IIVDGTLRAVGTEGKPIIFTESHDDLAGGAIQSGSPGPTPGRWDAITFNASSTGSMLDHVEARYGGENAAGEIIVNGGQLSLTNSKVIFSNTAGIRIQNANPTISGVLFKGNSIAARMDLGSNPAISHVSL